ncbi:MAG: autoinducer synthase [Qipengyuania sp.]|nr:autoinducer synthase [Qipengyuania sp.]
MFADRKQVFVDMLRWNVPVIDGRFEIDQFDSDLATYIIAANGTGEHLGSLRLLPTGHPHILGELFADLCDDGVPRGPHVAEITRLCLHTRLPAVARLTVRNQLITAMVDHCLRIGIVVLTGVVTWPFLEQILAMGWRAAPLGPPRIVAGNRLGAFRIELGFDTPARLATTGIYVPALAAAHARRAA